jgi:hypothetical protein
MLALAPASSATAIAIPILLSIDSSDSRSLPRGVLLDHRGPRTVAHAMRVVPAFIFAPAALSMPAEQIVSGSGRRCGGGGTPLLDRSGRR